MAVVALTNLHSNSKEAMDSLCEDGLIRRCCSLSVYLYGVHVGPVACRLGRGNELQLTHWILRGSCNGVWLKRGKIDIVSWGGHQLDSPYRNVVHIYTQHESAPCSQIMKAWYMKWDRKKLQAFCLGLFFSKLRQAQIRTSSSRKSNILA